jgi:aminopeptidase YwaD
MWWAACNRYFNWLSDIDIDKQMKMKPALSLLITLALLPVTDLAQNKPPLLPEPVVAALSAELSGETAKRNLEFISRQHRMRASKGFRTAADFVVEQARSYGLSDAEVLSFPADGKIFYGTQRSRPAWNAEFAELWEMDGGRPTVRIASWDAMPLVLAQDSESANVTAELVDVGAGNNERDYAGKDVKEKLVLVSAQPDSVYRLAVEKYGALGILSYAQNQRTAWFGENDNLIRWGHLDSFTATKTFAFMLSLKQARGYQARLARGDKITFKAEVRAGRHSGTYDIATAIIPGADPKLKEEEIVFSCHLDHPRPGANDNASGSVAILEVARTLAKLIKENKIPRPARTIRFIWPPEIEGTLTLLNARPDITRRIKAAIHMDMVGGGPETKSVFHVTRGPASLPSFVYDVAEAFGEFVNEQSYSFAATGSAAYPLIAPEGGKEPLNARMAEFSLGSDHQVYTDSSFSIPTIYLNDWPDRYIHTNFDAPANIDPTKLKRAAFIGGASGYFLANAAADDAAAVLRLTASRNLRRAADLQDRQETIGGEEQANQARFSLWHQNKVFNSISGFFPVAPPMLDQLAAAQAKALVELSAFSGSTVARGEGILVFKRNPEIKGTMGAFGYDYFTDKYGEEKTAAIRLRRYEGLRGSGGEYTYEVLNLVDGKRNVQQIRDALSAIYGPVPLDMVLEYLRALETIKVVQRLPGA